MKLPVLADVAIFLVSLCSTGVISQGTPQGSGSLNPPVLKCRPGYTAVRTKCYKFVRDRLDWQTAALNCGADGAVLARYDSDVDKALEEFFQSVSELNLHFEDAWIAGNTQVLQFGQRPDKTPFQADPPRMKLPEGDFNGKRGCFQGTPTTLGMLSLDVNENCMEKLPSVCEYDNTPASNFDPLDFVLIEETMSHDEAVVRCNELNRPLATIESAEQQAKVNELLKDFTVDSWISAHYDKVRKEFMWGDGSFITYKNWKEVVPRLYKADIEMACTTAAQNSGLWNNRRCTDQCGAVCGPSNQKEPLVFTPFFKVDAYKSIIELKENLRRLRKKDFVCDKPKLVQCSAYDGQKWVTSDTQQSDTLKCTRNDFYCKAGQELDCSTFQVRFLCPHEEDQCTELKKLKAPVCGREQECFPASNHYICRCPNGFMFSEHSRKCIKFCGECSTWGDPHYTTFNGKKYDFMGACKYKYTGVCDKKEFSGRANFDILTTNVRCSNTLRPNGSCLDRVEINLRNIPVITSSGTKRKEDFVFSYTIFQKEYMLNGKRVTDPVILKDGAYKAVVRYNYFSLSVYALDLDVFVNAMHLRVRVSEKFRGKLCGLCGDCGTDDFKLSNGTTVSVGQTEDGQRYLSDAIEPVALDWMVDREQFKYVQCGMGSRQDICTDEQKASVAVKELCGIFTDKESPLQKCFQETTLRSNNFHHGCIYDVCEMEDPNTALCGVIQSFAQECSSKGVLLDWRRNDFCPMACDADKEYRVDASCQKTCGAVLGQEGACDEEPAEGCVCKNGLYKDGNNCVPEDLCGCRVLDYRGTFIKFLRPEESVLMPGCNEKVKCERNVDGSLTQKHMDARLPPNTVCSDEIPPTTPCARGFLQKRNGKCQKNPCKENFNDNGGLCVQEFGSSKTWADAVKILEMKGATLPYIDTSDKIKAAKTILKQKKWRFMLVAGRVMVFNKSGFLSFKLAPNEADENSFEWTNKHFHAAFLDRIDLSYCITTESIPEAGLELCVMAIVENGNLRFKAIQCESAANFVGEQKA